MRTFVLAMVVAVAFLASPARADVAPDACSVRARPDSSQFRLLYDPFAGVQASDELRITFTARQQGCAFGLAIGGQGSRLQRQLVGAGGKLGYELRMKGAVVANDLHQPGVTIIPNPGQARNPGQDSSPFENLTVVVSSNQFAPAGTYRDQVTLRLFQIIDGVPQQTGEDVPLAIVVDIPARAQINLAGTSTPVFGELAASGLEFGELEAGKERQAFIQVRATAPVTLALTSENNGSLRHRVEQTAPTIPYSLTVDGKLVDLSSGPKRLDRNPNLGLGAENYRMVARILDVQGRVAGDYQDVITITVEPR